MEHLPLPEEIRRFVLTSIPSVPFLEALLLLRAEPAQQWQTDSLARRLYIRDKTAQGLLDNLCTAGMAVRRAAPQQDCYQYQPSSDALRARIDQLAELYARHLVEVTLLIHSSLDRKAQQFADAFKWRKDT
jgi:predicted transcriptional regulator